MSLRRSASLDSKTLFVFAWGLEVNIDLCVLLNPGTSSIRHILKTKTALRKQSWTFMFNRTDQMISSTFQAQDSSWLVSSTHIWESVFPKWIVVLFYTYWFFHVTKTKAVTFQTSTTSDWEFSKQYMLH